MNQKWSLSEFTRCPKLPEFTLKYAFFCAGIQFYLLLSPYLCFISLLYLVLYLLGDDAMISKGSFMQTKYLCVLIHICMKGEVSAVKPV